MSQPPVPRPSRPAARPIRRVDATSDRRGSGRAGAQAGAAAVELVLMAPLLVAFLLVIVAGGRYADSRGQVNDAAYAAARAASLEPDAGTARHAGFAAATQSLAERGKACAHLQVSFAGTDFRPGGQVQVAVTCRADLSDVAGFQVPGSREFQATAVVPIERYRLP